MRVSIEFDEEIRKIARDMNIKNIKAADEAVRELRKKLQKERL